LSGKN
ncbi:exonuclease family protein, partial [Escherichia coli PA49]